MDAFDNFERSQPSLQTFYDSKLTLYFALWWVTKGGLKSVLVDTKYFRTEILKFNIIVKTRLSHSHDAWRRHYHHGVKLSMTNLKKLVTHMAEPIAYL